MNKEKFIKVGLPVLMSAFIATGSTCLSFQRAFAATDQTPAKQDAKIQVSDFKASIQFNGFENEEFTSTSGRTLNIKNVIALNGFEKEETDPVIDSDNKNKQVQK